MHWTELGHHSDCQRTSRQVSRAEELRKSDDLCWLPWSRRATLDVEEGRETRCSLLRHLGVHGAGPYRRECFCYAKTPFGKLPREGEVGVAGASLFHVPGGGDSDSGGNAGDVVDAESAASDEDGSHVSTWRLLYRRLGLPSSSPAALVLSPAATVYHAMRLTGIADAPALDHSGPLVVHILGVEKELDQLDAHRALLEGLLRRLWGAAAAQGVTTRWGACRELQLHLIGPEVPMAWATGQAVTADGAVAERLKEEAVDEGDDSLRGKRRRLLSTTDSADGNLKMITTYMHRGLYHDVVFGRASTLDKSGDSCHLPPPSLVVAPNAGIFAFAEWEPTVNVLVRSPAPFVATDFTEEAARMGSALLASVIKRVEKSAASTDGKRMQRTILQVQKNPFRQPLSSMGTDNALPSYSNGFTFGFL